MEDLPLEPKIVPCKYCGKNIPETTNFCWYCGRELEARPERPEIEPGRRVSSITLLIMLVLLVLLTVIMVLPYFSK
jgi:predicted nucleic acid-binding Zn ribbon protein